MNCDTYATAASDFEVQVQNRSVLRSAVVLGSDFRDPGQDTNGPGTGGQDTCSPEPLGREIYSSGMKA